MSRIITANDSGNHKQLSIFQMAIFNGLSIMLINQFVLNAHIQNKPNTVEVTMNRKKKINQSLQKRVKKTNAKLHTSNKPKYVSKAERAKITTELTNDNSDNNESETKV